MQISHQHKLIIFSQIGSYCRVDSFGDIPGQVVSLFDLRIWTLKSALSLFYGLSYLVVKKFPCEGEHTVREADGQNKLWFSQVFRTLFVAMTLSHNFPKMRKHVHAFTASLLQSSSFLLWVDVATIFLSQIFSAVLFDDYIYTLDSFRGGSGQLIAQLPQHLATIPQHFLSFLFSAFQLLIYFHKPVIFPDVVDFPSVFKFSAFNYHFPAQPTPEQIQHSFPIVRKNIFLFLQISHYQQVHEPAYK